MRPSRSESWSVKQQQQQMAISRNKLDQWRREEWSDRSFKVLGVEIGHLPASQQFLVCAGGVFSFLIVYGYMQVGREERRSWQFELKAVNKYMHSEDPPCLELIAMSTSMSLKRGGDGEHVHPIFDAISQT